MERALEEESVFVGVKVDVGVGAEVHGIGTGYERAIVMIGIKHLDGERNPAASGTAIDETRPTLADGVELFFDGGD